MLKVFILLIASRIVYSRVTEPPVPKSHCGYQSCHPIKEGFINVHIVPHTHDDVGWLKTVDQYYYGSRTNIQKAGVQYILDSVVDGLKKDVNRRFIYVETAYFWKWWIKQDDTVKADVRNFVNNGQLEFISGGWSMNDEAVTNYQSIIDQMTWGLRKLNDTFGECGRPKIGWQIDPFGHSREMASIFAQLGFDGVLLGRIDYQDKNFRLKTKTPEMIWRSSSSLGSKSEIFTGVMYNTYSPPNGFCFDILCSDDPIIDDKNSADYNVDKRVDQFLSYVNTMLEGYATKNIIITMGDDFNYQDANVWFKNLDKLILYANERQQNGSKFNLVYSTPSCYIKAIHDETSGKMKWSVKQDDFFPYASDPHAFWTGYFTSRPTIKRYEREGNNFLQVCKQLYSLTDLGPQDKVDLDVMREAMGVMQHHDAITGTEKEHVAHDYARILSKGFDECEVITSTALSKIIETSANNDHPSAAIHFSTCSLLNISQCEFTEDRDKFVVTVYNPLSRPVRKFVRLPVLGKTYKVLDPEGNQVTSQLIPIAQPVMSIPGRHSKAEVELVFEALNLPPVGFKSYFVEKINAPTMTNVRQANEGDGMAEFQIDPETGFINKVFLNGQVLDLSQEFLYYEGFVGDNKEFSNRSSGAYIFRPTKEAIKVSKSAQVQIYRGSLVSEVHQQFNEWISQIIRVYEGENFVEFDWLIGPIPIIGHYGKEVVTRYKTSLKSNSAFYTDSNGRETMKRVRNFRPTWKLNLSEPIAGNYYPVTSKIAINDGVKELAILTDRAEGGSSLRDGELELMLHRLCVHDDAFGVGEPLIEEAFNRGLVTRGSHYLVFGNMDSNNSDGKSILAQERDLTQQRLLSPWIFLSSQEISFQEYKAKYQMEFSGLKRSLPDNVQILTLEPWKDSSFLLRLEHVFEKHEDSTLSKPVVVNLTDLFSAFQITSIRETTLGGNQWLQDNRRLRFETGMHFDDDKLIYTEPHADFKRATVIEAVDFSDDMEISLKPMQIRTFIIDIKYSQ